MGGQGVRLIAGVMGALLARMGKEVTVLLDYDSSVRGSMSDAFLIFDDKPIANPVVEEADILLKLADKGHLRISGRKVVTDLGLGRPGDEQIPFASLGSEHFRNGVSRVSVLRSSCCGAPFGGSTASGCNGWRC